MPGAWGWVAQEESSYLGKGVGSREPVLGVATAGRGGAAASGRGGPTGWDANSHETLAINASYGSAGRGGGGRSSRATELSWGTDEAGVVRAKTVGTGPDVTSVVAVVEAAMREVWENVGEDRPSEDEGNLATACPKPVEDAVSSSP